MESTVCCKVDSEVRDRWFTRACANKTTDGYAQKASFLIIVPIRITSSSFIFRRYPSPCVALGDIIGEMPVREIE